MAEKFHPVLQYETLVSLKVLEVAIYTFCDLRMEIIQL